MERIHKCWRQEWTGNTVLGDKNGLDTFFSPFHFPKKCSTMVFVMSRYTFRTYYVLVRHGRIPLIKHYEYEYELAL